ncbi:hypothetical protein F5Y13DRAFT_188846 [Hypoxylon sp. FL1857]|nr:hypothetical protein F5Y13DRAFT_188846 [Hypoxylon sp. FL1857]
MSSMLMPNSCHPEGPFMAGSRRQARRLMGGSWRPRADVSKPKITGAACQTIVCYHSCGCKSTKNSVHFCGARVCNHTTTTLVVAGLPFACASQNPRSEACGIEDIAKTEFIREVDTADRLDNFITLPDCTKEDINALIPAFAGSNWAEEIYNHYQRRKTPKSTEIPSQEDTLASQAVDIKGVDPVQDNGELQGQSEVQSEELKDGDKKEEEIARAEKQDEQLKSVEIDEELQAEIGLFKVGEDEDGDESGAGDSDSATDDGEQNVSIVSDIKQDVETIIKSDTENDAEDDAKKHTKERAAGTSESAVESLGVSDVLADGKNNKKDDIKSDKDNNLGNDVGKDVEEYTNVPLASPEVYDIDFDSEDVVGEPGDPDNHKGTIPPCAPTVGTTSYTPNPTMSTSPETNDATDDFIDFLLTAQEIEPTEKKSIWSCFRFF